MSKITFRIHISPFWFVHQFKQDLVGVSQPFKTDIQISITEHLRCLPEFCCVSPLVLTSRLFLKSFLTASCLKMAQKASRYCLQLAHSQLIFMILLTRSSQAAEGTHKLYDGRNLRPLTSVQNTAKLLNKKGSYRLKMAWRACHEWQLAMKLLFCFFKGKKSKPPAPISCFQNMTWTKDSFQTKFGSDGHFFSDTEQ